MAKHATSAKMGFKEVDVSWYLPKMVSTLRIILDRVLSLLENNIVRILRVSKEVIKTGKSVGIWCN